VLKSRQVELLGVAIRAGDPLEISEVARRVISPA
jgi:hypothetical protein